MPPAWWIGIRTRRAQCVSLEQASPYASRVPRLRRRRVYSTEEQRRPARMHCRPCCSPVLVRGLPGQSEATRAASSRNRAPTGQSWLSYLAAPGASTMGAAASERPERAGPPRSSEPATRRDTLGRPGCAGTGFPVGMDLEDAVQQACRGNVRAAAPVSPAVVAARLTRHPIRPATGRGDLPAVLGISPTDPFRFLWTGCIGSGRRPAMPNCCASASGTAFERSSGTCRTAFAAATGNKHMQAKPVGAMTPAPSC